MRRYHLPTVLLALLGASTLDATGAQPVPVGVTFDKETLYRSDGHGDNWCITWAADDSQITSMCDGDWLSSGHGYHVHLYRITGGPNSFVRRDIPPYPDFSGKSGSWFGYGKDKLGVRPAWHYFVRMEKGQPIWSADIEARGHVHQFPEKSRDGKYFGWYSWLPSVVWNQGLGLYIMVNGGTYAGHGMTASDDDYYDAWMHTRTGSLGFWYSAKPYGPWKQFFYTDDWSVDDPGNRTYQPKLSPKWISDNGRQMVLIWSDAMSGKQGHSHTVNYKWNQMAITLRMQ